MSQQALTVAEPEQVRGDLGLGLVSSDTKPLDPAAVAKAEAAAQKILSVDLSSPQNVQQVKSAVETLGGLQQSRAAAASKMLDQPLNELMKRGDDGGQVANSLIDLKMQVEELDPARFDFESGALLRILGKIPGVGTPMKRYFSRYQSAGVVIENIVKSLEVGRDQLKRDNITLADDQKRMRELTLALQQAIAIGQALDSRIQRELNEVIASDDPRHKFLQEEVLFPLRQRIQDLQQQLLVNDQGVLTMEIIIRNNKELIRGVARACDVTVNALRIAATLAIALANQRIVLEKVQSVTKTTEDILAGNAQRLKQQAVDINKQASEAQLSMDILEQCFQDIRTALDEVSRFRIAALPKMEQNISRMAHMSEQHEEQIRKLERAQAVKAQVSNEFTIDIAG